MVDVSSIKELARRWYPRAYFNAPKKGGGHRALADILESVQELRYYRAAVFVPQPGPTSEQAAAIAAALVAAGPRRRRSPAAVRHESPTDRYARCRTVVGVAQLVEHRVVIPVVAGSSPVTHPTRRPWSAR